MRYIIILFAHILVIADSWAETIVDTAIGPQMVIQRDRSIAISGRDLPNRPVSLMIANVRTHTTSDASGRWTVVLPAQNGGGPHTLVIEGSSRLEFTDILIGDVWLCSGQSNMEWPVSRSATAGSYIAQADNKSLRLLSIPRHISLIPSKRLPQEAIWQLAVPRAVSEFSAACYFFGLELQEALGIPIGLVNASWGGTIIESWIPSQTLGVLDSFKSDVSSVAEFLADPAAGQRKQLRDKELWWSAFDPGGAENGIEWTETDGASDFDSLGYSDFDGSAWYRTYFDSPGDLASEVILNLGCIDDRDTTWVNGELVGATNRWDKARKYRLSPGLLLTNDNELVVRVLDGGRSGGLVDCRSPRQAMLPGEVDLRADDVRWDFALGNRLPSDIDLPAIPLGENQRTVSVLYNGMIAPLAQYGIKGVAWYQGESNSGRSSQYQELLPLLVDSWRSTFESTLPFLIVQLSAYDDPLGRDWPGLREAQRRTVESDPNTRLIVTIDIGEKNDIHPKNKLDVGRRLSAAAQDLVYQKPVSSVGPTPDRAFQARNEVRIEFGDVGDGLKLRDGKTEVHLEFCSLDLADCTPVYAYQVNANTLGVKNLESVDGVIRYAWQNYPQASLENSNGLPAGPFAIRTFAIKGQNPGEPTQ